MPPITKQSGIVCRRRIGRLLGSALFLLCLWAFVEIAEDYPEGRYRQIDEAILRSLRTTADPAVPRGPLWLKDVMRDLSALGSTAVLLLTVSGVAGYWLLTGRRQAALSVTLTCAGGALLNLGLKAMSGRLRPEIVPHLTEATSTSFPSGHSMLSAIVYLSLGAMISQCSARKSTAVFALGFAALLTFVVGCTRIYLGVHYPSDVMAGWIAGTAWTLLCVAAHLRLVDQSPI